MLKYRTRCKTARLKVKEKLMLRFYIRLMLLLLGVFFAAGAIIRAQPYDESELRAFLTPPEGCPAPCFMGIRPGVTTAEEAVAILEAHEWVGKVQQIIRPNTDYSSIEWAWSDSRPLAVPQDGPNSITATSATYNIIFDNNISWGWIWLIFGKPDLVEYFEYPIDDFISYASVYSQHFMYMYFDVTCSMNSSSFWQANTTIIISNVSYPFEANDAIFDGYLEEFRQRNATCR
jgi:hypothetical protein